MYGGAARTAGGGHGGTAEGVGRRACAEEAGDGERAAHGRQTADGGVGRLGFE
jgi:hypothetical protein